MSSSCSPSMGGSVLFFCLGAAKTNLEGGLPPLCRPLFRERGFGLTKELAKLLLAPSWGTYDGLVLDEATSCVPNLSKTSEASWEDTVSGTLKAKNVRNVNFVGATISQSPSGVTTITPSGVSENYKDKVSATDTTPN